jgi:hypothetical protein
MMLSNSVKFPEVATISAASPFPCHECPPYAVTAPCLYIDDTLNLPRRLGSLSIIFNNPVILGSTLPLLIISVLP